MMKKLFTLTFILMVMLSFSSSALAQQDGDNTLFGVPEIRLYLDDSIKTSSVGRGICFVPASERLDGEELANILVTQYGYGGGVYVFKQIARNSLQFKLVWHSKFNKPNRSDY
jgi:hypothetical protein